MKKKVLKITAIVIALLFIISFAVGKIFGNAKSAAPAVDTAEVKKGNITSSFDTSGTISSEMQRVYTSTVNALVGDVPVNVGETVKKGAYLLTYDTASLEKSYTIAELNRKAEEATANDSLSKSNESAGDLNTSTSDIQTLQSQIDALNAEITSLQNQATGNEVAGNNNAETEAELSSLNAELSSVEAKIGELKLKKEEKKLSDKEEKQLEKLKDEKKEKEKAIEKKKKELKKTSELANDRTNISAQLAAKNNQLADLSAKLAEAQSKKAAAEAGVLSEAAKANIEYSRQAGKLTLEQTADELSAAKAGITADFDGIVTEVQASAGTMAAEGTALITLASAEQMSVDMPVSKYNLVNLKEGQPAVITFMEHEYKGTVSEISKIAVKNESGASMVNVKVHIENPDENLILGLDAKVKVDLGTAENVLSVPIASVNSDTKGDFVYAVEKNQVVKKYVVTGMASKEEIEIKKGLTEGEKVITSVDASVTEGMEVTENTGAEQQEEMNEEIKTEDTEMKAE